MINTLTFKNNQAQTINLHTDKIAIYKFDDPVTQRPGDSRPKMQQHGEYGTRTYRGGMTINIEGEIFGDDSADYFAVRQSIVKVLFPNPFLTVSLRRDGELRVGFEGSTEDWLTYVSVRAFTAPRTVENGGPSRSGFMLTFYSFTPYYTGALTGFPYQDS